MLRRKGQATTEMAIFGSLILICFAALLSYTQNLNEQQTLQMQAFRMALKKAYEDNGFVSYSILKNPRTINLFGGLGEGNRGSTNAGATVLWCKGEAENFAYYQVNEDLITVPSFEKQVEGESALVPAEVWDVEVTSDTNYQASEGKQENRSQISTSRRSQLRDTLTTRLKLRYQEKKDGPYIKAAPIEVTQGLDDDGRYRQSAVGQTVTRGRTWTTPF